MKKFYSILVLILLIILLPFIWSQLEPASDLSVAVIDKTVPSETYREHQGIHWLLNHLKIPNSDGGAHQLSRDYYGIYPNEVEAAYTMEALPEDYSSYDVIYLADTYGVYQADQPWAQGEDERLGERSEKIYGGLTLEEWEAMRRRFEDDTPSLLAAEYNSFASPTEPEVRTEVTDYLGIEWEGWVGRYFAELDLILNAELPQWLESAYGEDWKYSGPGFLLVNDINGEIVVLEESRHLDSSGLNVVYTKAGEQLFGLTESTSYDYWFDIVTPLYNTEVLANYQWHLNEAGEALLHDNGIPAEFAAVTRQDRPQHTSFYFAGDFNDIDQTAPIYRVKGMAALNQQLANLRDGHFYWSAFAPMMASILNQFEADELQVQSAEIAGGKDESNTDGEQAYKFRVHNDYFEVYQDGEWEPLIIKGVNMGMANPGHFPGEAGITEAEYRRWFEMIGKMNANTIRVYTIHPPGFYRALRDYNESHEDPLYLFHGVWMNEENLVASQDAFEPGNLAEFQEEIRKIVDLTHGNRVIPDQPGHASGTYDADISDYVIGWMIGVEWDPFVVQGTNAKHPEIGEYEGTYFETKGAAPFEHFLAQQMDLMLTYEIEQYGVQRPMSFTNWVTTDLLSHPTESAENEDMVSVNPNVIYPLGAAEDTGQYASYHVYPYYPDFLNYTKKYNEFIDHRGNPNNYAGYLKDLHEVHQMPVLIAEFGIPASRGRTHENPFGRHQGGVSEEEQGTFVSEMFEEIVAEGMMGGLIFTWQDEWFKRTWNTMDYDNPDRRPFWSNAQTNEQQFGLLSFDRHKIRINGDTSDWSEPPFIESDTADSPIQQVYVDHDERYLYIRVEYDSAGEGDVMLTLDTVPNQGNTTIEGIGNAEFSEAADFVVNLSEESPRILVDQYYDFFTIQYGLELEMLAGNYQVPEKNSGSFVPIHFALNKEYYVVDEERMLPFISYETGKLLEGNGDPASSDYNSMADYFVNREEGVIELRLPWLLISARDPSQKEFQGDLIEEGLTASVTIDDIGIRALYVEDQQVVFQTPTQSYTWENWDLPQSQERLKASYPIIQETFSEY